MHCFLNPLFTAQLCGSMASRKKLLRGSLADDVIEDAIAHPASRCQGVHTPLGSEFVLLVTRRQTPADPVGTAMGQRPRHQPNSSGLPLTRQTRLEGRPAPPGSMLPCGAASSRRAIWAPCLPLGLPPLRPSLHVCPAPRPCQSSVLAFQTQRPTYVVYVFAHL